MNSLSGMPMAVRECTEQNIKSLYTFSMNPGGRQSSGVYDVVLTVQEWGQTKLMVIHGMEEVRFEDGICGRP